MATEGDFIKVLTLLEELSLCTSELNHQFCFTKLLFTV